MQRMVVPNHPRWTRVLRLWSGTGWVATMLTWQVTLWFGLPISESGSAWSAVTGGLAALVGVSMIFSRPRPDEGISASEIASYRMAGLIILAAGSYLAWPG